MACVAYATVSANPITAFHKSGSTCVLPPRLEGKAVSLREQSASAMTCVLNHGQPTESLALSRRCPEVQRVGSVRLIACPDRENLAPFDRLLKVFIL